MAGAAPRRPTWRTTGRGVTSVLLVAPYTASMRLSPILDLVLLTVGCAITLGACGGSSPKPAISRSQAAEVKFSACMRTHGVPSFPDLSSSGGPFGLQIDRSGVDLDAPAFSSAMNACQKLAPAAKAATAPGAVAIKAQLVRLSECMRAHGLKTFPDPTTSSSTTAASASPSGAEIGYSGPGGSVSLSLSESIMQSPAFIRDAADCGFPAANGKTSAKTGPPSF